RSPSSSPCGVASHDSPNVLCPASADKGRIRGGREERPNEAPSGSRLGRGSVESGKDQSTPVHGGSQKDRGNGKESEQPLQGKGQQRPGGTAPPAATPVGARARLTG